MTLKWNRESVLVILMGIMILVGIFYYGNLYLLTPSQEEYDTLEETVATQEALIVNYPPSEELLEDYQNNYSATEEFLPVGVKMTEELVRFEQLANQSGVNLLNVTRASNQVPVEEVASDFYKNSYTAELTSVAPQNFRRLIQFMMEEERVWNVISFSYTKSGDQNYNASLTFEMFYYLNSTE